MHVLFITEKWCDCNPDRGLTNSYHNLFGSLESTGLASFSVFHPDEFMQINQREFFTPLMFYIFQVKPDVIIATWYSTDILELFKQVKEKVGVPVVALWWDSVSQMHMSEAFLPYVAFNIVVDSTESYKESRQPEKYISLWTPQDPRIFYNPDMIRDVDVSFAGTMNSHPYRNDCLLALSKAGIKVLQTGGQREQRLLISDYASIYKRSRIVLNFAETPSGKKQLKGRVFEATLSGALLVDSYNEETAKKFVPFKEYAPFMNELDIVNTVEYHLSHESVRAERARAGQRRSENDYSADKFWSTVFDKARSL